MEFEWVRIGLAEGYGIKVRIAVVLDVKEARIRKESPNRSRIGREGSESKKRKSESQSYWT
ncbi:hypothetical protein PZE06_03790 [Robertmurraya sp. DFI.2.37]|uniref:hypothetical protein n=1 Tax=Robertmurraya sp. DFI.2.37 TaxID=3031819 RepID=UPI001245A5EF|nr:hypothetical protein [Robertmurraya sp. DFI.2.37]MDF1507300.1 hypothetical protein [Robertmurraya sp. DFI.2.37]